MGKGKRYKKRLREKSHKKYNNGDDTIYEDRDGIIMGWVITFA